MAYIFRTRPNTDTPFRAKIKVIDPKSGKSSWKTIATKTRDPDAAVLVAKRAEEFVNQGITQGVTRVEAEELVEALLRIIGSNVKLRSPELSKFGNSFIAERIESVGESTGRKYQAHWARFCEWAGTRMELPVGSWELADFKAYYKDLQSEFSNNTANGHLQTLTSVFEEAKTNGYVKANVVAQVKRENNDSIQKEELKRTEMNQLVRYLRKRQLSKWTLLSLLGWHTGHRFEDLQGLAAENVIWRGENIGFVVEIQPAKKESRGGRTVELPIPNYVAKMIQRLGDAHVGNNRNGIQSTRFIELLELAGIEVQRVKRGKREFSMKSFHSFRHSMASRLAAAGVSGNIARLITDHDSEKVHNRYVHAELESISQALKKIR